jgi:hypothetical protein
MNKPSTVTLTYLAEYTKELADQTGVPSKGTYGIPQIADFDVLYTAPIYRLRPGLERLGIEHF